MSHYETIEDVIENITRFKEDIYNSNRVRSSLGYLTPVEFVSRKAEKQKQLVIQKQPSQEVQLLGWSSVY